MFRRRLLLLAAAGLAGFGAHAASAETLEVGAYPANPPFEYRMENGQFDGFEVDVVKAIAAKLGADVKISDLGFQALFAATAARRIDLAISTIAVTKARLQNQDFSQPYIDTGLVIAAGPSSSLKSQADARGKAMGAIASSTGETWLRANRERLGIGEIKTYDTQANLLLDTANGRIEGAVNDIGGILYAMKTVRGLRIVEKFPSDNQIAIMLPKNSPLTPRLNEALSAIKQDGTMAALWRKWFGADPEAGSSTVTVLPQPKADS